MNRARRTVMANVPRAMLAVLAVLAGPALWTSPAHAEPRRIDIQVKAGQPVNGVQAVRLVRGDEVTLRVTADAADELHLHGYDLHAHLRPGQPGVLSFTARRTGRFAAELHKSGTEVVVLEIYPR
jgi:hypothetical protein